METTDVPGIPPFQEPIPIGFWKKVLVYAKTKAQTADAEDRTQEAYLETVEKPTDPSVSLERRKALVFGIVKNKHRHWRRHAAVELKSEAEIGREIEANRSRLGEPEHDADHRQLRGLEFTAMSELNPFYEQVVDMRFFGEMSRAEIADALGKTPEQISNALACAMAQLRADDGLRNYSKDMES